MLLAAHGYPETYVLRQTWHWLDLHIEALQHRERQQRAWELTRVRVPLMLQQDSDDARRWVETVFSSIAEPEDDVDTETIAAAEAQMRAKMLEMQAMTPRERAAYSGG